MKRLWLVVLCLAAASLSLVAVHARMNRKQAAMPVASAQAGDPKSAIEVEVVKLLPGGFEPSQFTRPAGKFLLVIQNATGLSLPAAQLLPSTGPASPQPLLSVAPPPGKMFEEITIDLTAGSYLFKESALPYRQCVINITASGNSN